MAFIESLQIFTNKKNAKTSIIIKEIKRNYLIEYYI